MTRPTQSQQQLLKKLNVSSPAHPISNADHTFQYLCNSKDSLDSKKIYALSQTLKEEISNIIFHHELVKAIALHNAELVKFLTHYASNEQIRSALFAASRHNILTSAATTLILQLKEKDFKKTREFLNKSLEWALQNTYKSYNEKIITANVLTENGASAQPALIPLCLQAPIQLSSDEKQTLEKIAEQSIKDSVTPQEAARSLATLSEKTQAIMDRGEQPLYLKHMTALYHRCSQVIDEQTLELFCTQVLREYLFSFMYKGKYTSVYKIIEVERKSKKITADAHQVLNTLKNNGRFAEHVNNLLPQLFSEFTSAMMPTKPWTNATRTCVTT